MNEQTVEGGVGSDPASAGAGFDPDFDPTAERDASRFEDTVLVAEEWVRDVVRMHPGVAMLIAGLIGFVVARVIRGRE